MGVMARQRDDKYVITSDRLVADSPGKGAPKRTSADDAVWTGDGWSLVLSEAMTFPSLDAADEYVRANYPRIMKE